jgi:hypothetical protein
MSSLLSLATKRFAALHFPRCAGGEVEADVSCRSVCASTIGRGREEEAFLFFVDCALPCLSLCGVCAVDVYYCNCWLLAVVQGFMYMYVHVCMCKAPHACVSRACAIALTYRQDMYIHGASSQLFPSQR